MTRHRPRRTGSVYMPGGLGLGAYALAGIVQHFWYSVDTVHEGAVCSCVIRRAAGTDSGSMR